MNESKEMMAECLTEKQTLKNSLEKLNQRNYELSDIAALSSRLSEKFFNPNDEPRDMESPNPVKEKQPDNIVEVFDDVSERISRNINIIASNLHSILNMMD
tara:strand:+ start:422 stop:724 length:303 start_codon:yes stop_codon:yes gene_type:complete